MWLHYIVMMGTAGCGKSTLASALESFMKNYDLDVITVNLDPASRRLPYTPDVDVRDMVDIDEVMNQLGLGPNGALVAAVDMVAGQVDQLKEMIEESKSEYAIIDTPGQIELFAYRSTGPLIVSALQGTTTTSLHLLDPNLVRNASGYVSLTLLGLSLLFRFTATQFTVLAKSDLLSEEEIDRIVNWSVNPVDLYENVDLEGKGGTRDLNKMISEMLERIGSRNEIIPLSAQNNEGIDALYAELERVWTTEVT
jgi:GTPase SAR1 family protein